LHFTDQFQCSIGLIKLKLIVLALLKGFLNQEGLLNCLLAPLAAWTFNNIIMADLGFDSPPGQWEVYLIATFIRIS